MKTLWLTAAGLIGIHVVLTVTHYQFVAIPWYVRQIFDVDEEASFPTWYSAYALLLTAVVLWIKARGAQRAAQAWHWHVLALGFLVLSIDEIAGIHETINSLITFSWAIPGGILAGIVGLCYVPFLLKLERRMALQFIIGGIIFVGGSVGVELYTEPYLKNDQLNTMAYNLWNAVEEGMEMAGVLIFLHPLLLGMKGAARTLPLGIGLRD